MRRASAENQMHQLIYAIVTAPTADDALHRAHGVFDGLTGGDLRHPPVFDYYVTFDDESSQVAGPARWGERPTVAWVESPDGQALLANGWDATERAFERNLTRVREALAEYDDAAIMGDADLVRHACRNLGAYRGPPLHLYDEHGQGIRDRPALDRLLEADHDEPLWIVPADVHY